MVESELIQKIAGEYPEILNPDLTQWEITNIARRWVAGTVRWCSTSYKLEQNKKKTWVELIEDMESDRGGFWCGGTAHILKLIYNQLGFAAGTYDYGLTPSLTHVVTLVQIENEGISQTVVQDAYLNCCVCRPDKQPLDLLATLENIAIGNTNKVFFNEDLINRFVIWNYEEKISRSHIYNSIYIAKLYNGAYKYKLNISGKWFMQRMWDAVDKKPIRDRIKADGYPETPASLMLYPRSLYCDWDQKSYLTHIRKISQSTQNNDR